MRTSVRPFLSHDFSDPTDPPLVTLKNVNGFRRCSVLRNIRLVLYTDVHNGYILLKTRLVM